jgi:hypothetical protein
MKIIKLAIFYCVFCVISLSAQNQNPLFITQKLDFAIRDSIDSNGNKYIGYAGQLPSLITFVNSDGMVLYLPTTAMHIREVSPSLNFKPITELKE